MRVSTGRGLPISSALSLSSRGKVGAANQVNGRRVSPFLHDRHFRAASSFQIGVVRVPPPSLCSRLAKVSSLSPIDQTARRHTARLEA
jgi:hypothetical protein